MVKKTMEKKTTTSNSWFYFGNKPEKTGKIECHKAINHTYIKKKQYTCMYMFKATGQN